MNSESKAVPRFSVIMNVFNGERYLRESIECVLAQTFNDWELIIWDDQSEDGSAAICREFKDPRIRYFLAPQRGFIGKARDLAIRQAGGEWLAFLDQDDLWSPTKLAGQNRLIQQDRLGKLGMVYGRTMLLVESPEDERDFDRWHEFSPLPQGDIFRQLVQKPSFVALSSAILLRSAVIELGGIPESIKYCPDYYLFVQVARNYHAACLQEVCCWYRVHETNMSHVYNNQINQEIIKIIEGCSGAVGDNIIRRRRKVHNSLIGWADIKTGGNFWSGIGRIYRQGSLGYIIFRPYLYALRVIRRGLKNKAMKYKFINAIRSLGLLKVADTVKYWLARLAVSRKNRRFEREFPGFPVPLHDIAFDAYNHIDWYQYRESGLRHAGVFAEIIGRHQEKESLRIFEWGCGPGRLIRHLPRLLANKKVELVGGDYNLKTISWCRENFPDISFVHNELMPPLSFPDDHFDVVYNFSVFTHLSKAAQDAWIKELFRVLKPGGLVICTTHGENYRYLLTTKSERARYESGEVVVQGGYSEGKKWFFSIHPEAYVRNSLLHDFHAVHSYPVERETGMLQDVWVGQKA